MEKQEQTKKKFDFVAKRVKSHINNLVAEADKYTMSMNKDYEYFFVGMPKICTRYNLNFPNTAN